MEIVLIMLAIIFTNAIHEGHYWGALVIVGLVVVLTLVHFLMLPSPEE